MEAVLGNEPEKESRRLRVLSWFTGLFLIVVIYILSIGPVIRLVETGSLPGAVMGIYAPLRLATEYSEVTHDFIAWYLGIWTLD